MLGLFFGYLMGQALLFTFSAILDISTGSAHLPPPFLAVCKTALFLFGLYIGTLTTLRASDELSLSVPFIRFNHASQKRKDLIIDVSVLSDARIIDLAASGLLDSQLIMPRFLIKELYLQAESPDESIRNKAKKAIDILKKLESMHELSLKYNDTDFPESKDLFNKIIRLSRLLDANVITADLSQVQTPVIEKIRFINLHDLAKALKPLMFGGESIKIKIQRYGKEPRQGVGYLEDGTMVVVNGGGHFIGEQIDVQVLSVKHTTSGRMIFCNALSDGNGYPQFDESDE
jgi:uncharacterized protein YacL